MKADRILLILAMVLAISCKKEEPIGTPTIKSFRSYDMNPFQVKETPQGGYVLQCIEGSIAISAQPRASFAQFLDAFGEPISRIDHRNLPDTIEDRVFEWEDRWITDIVPLADGHNILIGIGVENAGPLGGSMYLLVYEVDANGNELGSPMYRLLSTEGEMVYDGSSIRDPTPITRAYGTTLENGDLAVAVTVHPNTPVGIANLVVLRIPGPGSSLEDASLALEVPDEPAFALWSFVPFGEVDHMLLVAEGSGGHLVFRELDMSGQEIQLVSGSTLGSDGQLWPFFVAGSNGLITVGGSTLPIGSGGHGGTFMTTAASLSEADLSAGFHTYTGSSAGNTNTQCYAGTWWNNGLAMTTSTYSADLREPYHRHDTKCDLGLMLVAPGTGAVILERTILAGQGLRGLGLFNTGGRLICIGARNAYNNLSVPHAFFMELNDPRLSTNDQ
ncbi:MAG: hypothetical protein JNL43_02570 [Flavobacteriales bacterium]|nr:hypothetical protein [Flavobacteriales bacterium]